MVAKTQFANHRRGHQIFPQRRAVRPQTRGDEALVATDGHRLALVSVTRNGGNDKKDADEIKAILPKKTLGELGRLLGEGDGDIATSAVKPPVLPGRGSHADLADDRRPVSRVRARHSQGNDKHIEFERDRLTSAVKRVALLSNERSRAVRC